MAARVTAGSAASGSRARVTLKAVSVPGQKTTKRGALVVSAVRSYSHDRPDERTDARDARDARDSREMIPMRAMCRLVATRARGSHRARLAPRAARDRRPNRSRDSVRLNPIGRVA